MQFDLAASIPPTSRPATRRPRRLPGSALALVLLAAAALLPACAEDTDEPETRCGGGAPQCCCDTHEEVDRYQLTCRAACEDNPDRPDGVCVSETACGGA